MFESIAVPPTVACKLGQFIVELTDADRKNLIAALEQPAIATNQIVRALHDEAGSTIGKEVVANHRRGSCACSPS